jgi:hypothetical protein
MGTAETGLNRNELQRTAILEDASNASATGAREAYPVAVPAGRAPRISRAGRMLVTAVHHWPFNLAAYRGAQHAEA